MWRIAPWRSSRRIGFIILIVLIAIVNSPTITAVSTVLWERSGQDKRKWVVNSPDITFINLLPIVIDQHPQLVNETVFGIESTKQITADQSGFLEMVSAGSVWFRRSGFLWSEIEASKGSYDWSALADFEEELILASEQKVQIIPVIRGTPSWAQIVPEQVCGPIKQENLIDFGNFLFSFVDRYSKPPYNLRYIEIWNEPDISSSKVSPDSGFGCWGDEGDEFYGGGYYAEMLRTVYPRVKETNPEMQIIIGGLLLDCDPENVPRHKIDCLSSKFFEGILKNGGGSYFDGVGFHSYDYAYGGYYYENPNWHTASDKTGPVLVAKAAYLNNLMEQFGITNKFIINTETALLCVGECNTEYYDLALAYYLTHSYAYAVTKDLRASLWFSIFGWLGSGLLDRDLSLLPAYISFQFANQKIGNSQFIREINDFQGVRGLEFINEGGKIWILWSGDGGNYTIQLPARPESIWDAMGNPQPISVTLTITPKPLYLDWPP